MSQPDQTKPSFRFRWWPAAVILVVAIVAAIALTLRKRSTTSFMKPEQQVLVKRKDRVRLVKMAAEKKDN